ncbi:stonustoxin subunit beta-like [Bradysia coprophila]|uniref:stonustoxin subunit beta-like n=1 Tax=Bradysia coprophila TaxID=38358 RepID=UPI00187DD548|nr:stonustoxin subunit beta-like [Bradysia coprophila]
MAITTTDKTYVAAVGRVAYIGSLFNCRTNSFLNFRLFSKPLDEQIIETTDNWHSNIEMTKTNSFNEKFDMLSIAAELRLSILCGLIEVGGSGRFLKDVKKSARATKASLVYSATTKYDEINIIDERVKKCINYNMLSSTDATHVVIGISWGGNVIISVEDSNSEGKEKQTIEGNMQAAVKKFRDSFEVNGSGSVNIDESVVEEMTNFKFELFGDLLNDTNPQTIAEALEIIRLAPTSIKQANNGRGKAVAYTLVPIQKLRDILHIDRDVSEVINHISSETIRKVVSLFDDMNIAEQKLNDLVNDVNSFAVYIDPIQLEQLNELQNNYEFFQHNIRDKLAKLLNTSVEVKDIVSLVEQTVNKAKSDDLSPKRIEARVRQLYVLYREIDFVRNLMGQNVEMLDVKTDFKWYLLRNKQRDVIVMCYNFQQTMDETMETFVQLKTREYTKRPLFAAINLCLDGVSTTLAREDKVPSVRVFRNANEVQISDLTSSDDSDNDADIYVPLIQNEVNIDTELSTLADISRVTQYFLFNEKYKYFHY